MEPLNQSDDPENFYTGCWDGYPYGFHRWDTRGAMVPEERFPEDYAERVSEPRYGFPGTEGANSINDREFAPGGFVPHEVMLPSGPVGIDDPYDGGEYRYNRDE